MKMKLTKYYKILSLPKDSCLNDVKKAYRKLSMKYHPDLNPNLKNYDIFDKITKAYDILMKKDDSLIINDFEEKNKNDETELLFTEILNIYQKIYISVKDIYDNTPIKINYRRRIKCSECDGIGRDKNHNKIKCSCCDGSGGYNGRGDYCETCQGKGFTFDYNCSKCNGNGFIISVEELIINDICSKFFNLNRLELRNLGNCNRCNDNNGFLIIEFELSKSFYTDYKIYDNKLYQTIDVHYKDAIEGNYIEFNTLNNKKVRIKLKEKTYNNQIYKVKKLGFYDSENNTDNERTDLFIKINIIIDYNKI